jgi:hypothetical protein
MKMKIGEWEMEIGSSRFINQNLIRKLEKFLSKQWRKAVLEKLEKIDQPWWSVRYLRIPSPLVRIDMAPTKNEDEDVKNFIYEIEVRPGGLGVTLFLLPPEKVKKWKEVLRQCKGFITIKSSIQDDRVAAEILGIPYYEEIPNDLQGPYWVRSNERSGEITGLEDISLVPIRLDGDKTYLVELGMAEMVKEEILKDQKVWSKPFVVKPLIGSRMEGVEIYIPNSLAENFGKGASTKTKVLDRITQSTPYIVQKFISPQREKIRQMDGWTIWRVFFGYLDDEYNFIGGLWNWRPNIRVHGASDAVFGILEEI